MSTRKTETSSGFSLQPDLFNRMYDDGKSSYKKNQKDKEIKKNAKKIKNVEKNQKKNWKNKKQKEKKINQ